MMKEADFMSRVVKGADFLSFPQWCALLLRVDPLPPT